MYRWADDLHLNVRLDELVGVRVDGTEELIPPAEGYPPGERPEVVAA